MKWFKQGSFVFFQYLLMIMVVILFVGCEEKFIQIDSKELRVKWDASRKHSAVSWWYLGEKDSMYYLLEKWPMKKNGFKINKSQLGLLIENPEMELTLDSVYWINLKTNHLVFKK